MSKRPPKKEVNKDAWLATYSDMVTLILVFFILLFAMSSIDQEKYEMLVEAFTADAATLQLLAELKQSKSEPKPEEGTTELSNVDDIDDIEDFDDLYVYLKNYVKDRGLEASIHVEKADNLVYVRFMSTLFFEPNMAVLKPDGQRILDEVGQALGRAEHIAKFVRIDGHTAEAAPGNDSVNNRDLSTERANVVLKFLEANHIKDRSKLYAVGYGFYRPIAPNDREENRAKNRRVEILIGKEDPLQDVLDELYGLDD